MKMRTAFFMHTPGQTMTTGKQGGKTAWNILL
jgi:hypothetical protein